MPETSRWSLYAPFSGILAVALWVVSFVIMQAARQPDFAAPSRDIVAYYERDSAEIFTANVAFVLGSLAFLWFVTTLRSHEFAHEGGAGHRSALMFGSGIVTTALLLALPIPSLAMANAVQGAAPIEPAAAQLAFHLDDGVFIAARFATALFLVATAMLALRTRVLPAWLGWAAVVTAVLLVIPRVDWLAMSVLFPLWLIAASVMLWRHESAELRISAAPARAL